VDEKGGFCWDGKKPASGSAFESFKKHFTRGKGRWPATFPKTEAERTKVLEGIWAKLLSCLTATVPVRDATGARLACQPAVEAMLEHLPAAQTGDKLPAMALIVGNVHQYGVKFAKNLDPGATTSSGLTGGKESAAGKAVELLSAQWPMQAMGFRWGKPARQKKGYMTGCHAALGYPARRVQLFFEAFAQSWLDRAEVSCGKGDAKGRFDVHILVSGYQAGGGGSICRGSPPAHAKNQQDRQMCASLDTSHQGGRHGGSQAG
jgi:hypothetical protein